MRVIAFLVVLLFLASNALGHVTLDTIKKFSHTPQPQETTIHEKHLHVPQGIEVHLYDCFIAASALSQCRPANIVMWRHGQSFTLGLKISNTHGKPLPNAKVTLAVVDRDSEIIDDAIMLWGRRTVTASTDAKGQALFRYIFFPSPFLIGSNLSVVVKIAGSKHLAKFPLIRNAAVRLVGKPNYQVIKSFPMTAVWSLTYDDMLLAATEVSWYVIASNGVTATQKLNLLERPTNRIVIRASSDNINKNIFNGECHTLVVNVMPPGAGKQTITASRIGC